MQINLWVTSECNMKCRYCYEKDSVKYRGHFNALLESKLIQFMKDQNVEMIYFNGGEPLLNFALIKRIVTELLNYSNNIQFGLTTNGTVLSEEMLQFFIKYKEHFDGLISISIDGTESTYNRYRVSKGNVSEYSKVLGNGKKLLAIMNVRCRMTVVPESVKKLYDNISYLYSLGFREIIPIFDIYNSKWEQSHFDELEKQYEKIIEFWLSKPYFELGTIRELTRMKYKGKCKSGTNVYINGDIYPCVSVVGQDKFIIGSIVDGIDHVRVNELNKLFGYENELCSECVNKKLCVYQRCKLYNYSMSGDLYMPSESACMLEHFKFYMNKKYFERLKKGLII